MIPSFRRPFNLVTASSLCLLLGTPLASASVWQAVLPGTTSGGTPGAASSVPGPGVQGTSGASAGAVRAALLPGKQLYSVGLLPGADLAVIGQSGAQQLAAFGQAGIPLSPGGPDKVVEVTWPTSAAAATGLAYLRQAPGVLFTESLRKASPPESLGCGAVAGPQQCTAAFFDSGPTLPKYAEQPALPVMAVGSDTQAAANALTIVAVIDTGIDPTHPLLAGRVFGPGYDYILGQAGGWDLPDGLDNDGDAAVDEGFGHGTHVAGLIVLMDPAAKLLSYRVLDADGVGNSYAVAAAIYRAVEEGAMIINLSLSLSGPSLAVEEAIEHAVDEGVAVFASAGNTGSEGVLYPARYEEVVAVAALDAADIKAGFSAFGSDVDLVAPGIDLYSAMPFGQYAWWSGTSMATALASGANSRLISHKPDVLLSVGAGDDDLALAAGVGEVLVEQAQSVDGLNPSYAGKLGKGRVHVANAAQALPTGAGGGDDDD
jgi:Subtilase family